MNFFSIFSLFRKTTRSNNLGCKLVGRLVSYSVNWSIVALVVLTMAAAILIPIGPTAQAASATDGAFQKIWQQSDGPIASSQVSRSWLWGATPDWSGYESYDQASGGQRLVQYFDKSRMEINDPNANPASQWYVSNGLLTMELVSGKMQVGNNRFEVRAPANIPVAGDLQDNAGPTYASLAPLTVTQDSFAADRTGQLLTQEINAQGQVVTFQPPLATSYAYYEAATRHNIPAVLWIWMQNIPGSDWTFALGYPVSEAYWSTFKVGGVDKLVLVQLFQRRVLTFTPSNDPAWQVEMGNIGLHYFNWRYNGQTPVQALTTTSTRTLDGVSELDTEEEAFLQTINAYRKANGLGELTFQPQIENAARWMAQDMAEKNYFSHTDSRGRDPFARMAAFNFDSDWMGENLAAGKRTGIDAFGQFKASPGHNANMLKAQYTKVGIARFFKADSTYGWYWAVDFGN